MSDQVQASTTNDQVPEEKPPSSPDVHRKRGLAIKSLILLLVFAAGIGSGYLMWGHPAKDETAVGSAGEQEDHAMALMQQVNPPEGYSLPAIFGDIGPKLVAAGAIDVARFVDLYDQQKQPLDDAQMTMLTKGSDESIIIKPENAYFLLNFFWAVGLTNENPILTEGPMMSRGAESVGGFASTGGWTLGKKDPTALYASTKIMVLTDEQQARLLEVASAVYRPCCDNPTHFPDCNHGMAMLGLLELMASQDASSDEMFEAAKYVNAFWYPQQMLELAIAFQALKSVDFVKADARTIVSQSYSSGSGFQAVHQWLGQNGLLEQAPSNSGSCGVR